MRTPFHEILHPPEVRGQQLRRYWIAVVGWFVLVILVLALVGILGYLTVVSLEAKFGTEGLRPYEMWILGFLLAGLAGSIFLGDYLWGLLFVSTGYLSREAVIRIRTNRAPTTRGERMHRRISLSLSLLIPVCLVGVGWYLDAWWMMGLAILLGGWLLLSVWAAWKSADAMVDGNLELPTGLEERVMHGLNKPTKRQDKR